MLIISTSLLSCSVDLPAGFAIEEPYIVKSIDGFSSELCKYNLSTNTDFLYFIDEISVVDSIGKFNIGDSVRINLNKQ